MQTIEDKLFARVRARGRGWAFSARDFVTLGRVDTALTRLCDSGKIRRVIRGIYDYPPYSELLKCQLSPDIHEVARAIARKFAWEIEPDGATALNLLGLSTQVPATAVYRTNGPSRRYQVEKQTLQFLHTSMKDIGFQHQETAILVQAIKATGQHAVTGEAIIAMRKWLPAAKRDTVLKDARQVTGWVYDALREICKEEKDAGDHPTN